MELPLITALRAHDHQDLKQLGEYLQPSRSFDEMNEVEILPNAKTTFSAH